MIARTAVTSPPPSRREKEEGYLESRQLLTHLKDRSFKNAHHNVTRSDNIVGTIGDASRHEVNDKGGPAVESTSSEAFIAKPDIRSGDSDTTTQDSESKGRGARVVQTTDVHHVIQTLQCSPGNYDTFNNGVEMPIKFAARCSETQSHQNESHGHRDWLQRASSMPSIKELRSLPDRNPEIWANADAVRRVEWFLPRWRTAPTMTTEAGCDAFLTTKLVTESKDPDISYHGYHVYPRSSYTFMIPDSNHINPSATNVGKSYAKETAPHAESHQHQRSTKSLSRESSKSSGSPSYVSLTTTETLPSAENLEELHSQGQQTTLSPVSLPICDSLNNNQHQIETCDQQITTIEKSGVCSEDEAAVDDDEGIYDNVVGLLKPPSMQQMSYMRKSTYSDSVLDSNRLKQSKDQMHNCGLFGKKSISATSVNQAEKNFGSPAKTVTEVPEATDGTSCVVCPEGGSEKRIESSQSKGKNDRIGLSWLWKSRRRSAPATCRTNQPRAFLSPTNIDLSSAAESAAGKLSKGIISRHEYEQITRVLREADALTSGMIDAGPFV